MGEPASHAAVTRPACEKGGGQSPVPVSASQCLSVPEISKSSASQCPETSKPPQRCTYEKMVGENG